MASIGVRELRQRASEFLRRVEAGETIEVTDRGRPVALLSPIPEGSPLDRLRAGGMIEPVSGDLDFPEPLDIGPTEELPSQVLTRMRSDER